MVRAPLLRRTSTPVSQYHDVVVLAGLSVALPVKSPAPETYEVWCARLSWVFATDGFCTYRLIARSAWSGTRSATGSLTAIAPGGMVIDAVPLNVRRRSVPATMSAPWARTPTLAALMVNGVVPIAFEKRTRIASAPRLMCTISRSVTLVNVGGAANSGACIAAPQVATQSVRH